MSTKLKKGNKNRYFSGNTRGTEGVERRNSGRVYCADRKLLPRIKQCVSDHSRRLSLDDLVSSLQSQYAEYGRRKRNAFRSQVERVYDGFMDDSFGDNEREYLRKRTHHDEGEQDSIEDSDVCFELTSDSEVELTTEVSGNMMNDFMTHIYGQGIETTSQTYSLSVEQDTTKNILPESSDVAIATDELERGVVSDDIISKHSRNNDIDQRDVAMETTANVVAMETKSNGRGIVNDQSHIDSKRRKKRKRNLEEQEENRSKKKGIKEKRRETDLDQLTVDALHDKHKSDIPLVHSTTHFNEIGGCTAALEDVCQLLMHFRHPEVFQQLGVSPPRGFLLHGPPGCGKTLLAHAIAGEIEWPMLCLAATEVVSGVSGETEEKLRNLFNRAKEYAPCILFIDEIDAITPKRETAQREMERRVVTQLLACMDDLNNNPTSSQVLVIGATNRVDALDPGLRRSGRFDKEISLGIPDENARKQILEILCRGLTVQEGLNFSHIAHQSPGYVGADLMALTREAAMSAVNRVLPMSDVSHDSHMTLDIMITRLKDKTPLSVEVLNTVSITSEDFKVALSRVQPSSKREGFVTVPDTTWDDIGALGPIREELTMAILAPVRYPDQFAKLGLKHPPGILLAGPPGCGKTLLAKAIANESGINFISVKGPELLNMYVGESERAVRQVFQRARNSSPCVIFFDELDALCPRRSDVAESSSSARVVNQLLTEMDGLESRKQVFIMGATNRPDIIDPAVLRPGRLDKILYVGLPSCQDRIEILKTITKDGTCPRLHSDVNISLIGQSDKCNGFSGADLVALVRESSCIALKEYMLLTHTSLCNSDITSLQQTQEECIVYLRHFEEAFTKVHPSVSEKDRMKYLENKHI